MLSQEEKRIKERARFRRWYEKNKASVRRRAKIWFALNRPKKAPRQTKPKIIRTPKIKRTPEERIAWNKGKWKRRMSSPAARIEHSLRNRLRWFAVRTKRPARNFQKLLGCSKEQFRAHIEEQFKRGMSWENYGRKWHLDHVVPCAAFDLSLDSEREKCFHFSNIQPLWSLENVQKSDKIVTAQPELILSFSGRANA